MTSAHKTTLRKQQKGFTLLEVIITMVIISTMIAGAVLYMSQSSQGPITELAQKTQILAKKTLREAKSTDRPQSIYISHNAIWAQAELVTTEDQTFRETPKGSIPVPEDITVSYLMPDDSTWTRLAKNDAPLVWAFTQTGLCEAISLKFESEKAVHELSFHALTAGELTNEY